MAVIDIRRELLTKELANLRSDYAFWTRQPGQVKYTLLELQKRIDDAQRRLDALRDSQ